MFNIWNCYLFINYDVFTPKKINGIEKEYYFYIHKIKSEFENIKIKGF